MTATPAISIVIPVFNAADGLEALIVRIRGTVAASRLDAEIVIVDDASTDDAPAALRQLRHAASGIVVVRHLTNRGQAAATRTGVKAARRDVVVTLDDDLQHDPDDIARLLAALADAGPDALAIGVRDRARRPLWRDALGSGANAVSNLFLGKPLPLRMTTFCAFRKSLCAHLEGHDDIALITELVQTARITVRVPVAVSDGRASRYRAASLWRLFMARARCYRPLRVAASLVASALMLVISHVWALRIAEAAAAAALVLSALLAGAMWRRGRAVRSIQRGYRAGDARRRAGDDREGRHVARHHGAEADH